jgi:hypothetical protein
LHKRGKGERLAKQSISIPTQLTPFYKDEQEFSINLFEELALEELHRNFF